jgi:hypothetical protein
MGPSCTGRQGDPTFGAFSFQLNSALFSIFWHFSALFGLIILFSFFRQNLALNSALFSLIRHALFHCRDIRHHSAKFGQKFSLIQPHNFIQLCLASFGIIQLDSASFGFFQLCSASFGLTGDG